MNPRMPGLELWFVTGSQHLYGPEVLGLVDEHARAIAAGLDGQAAIPVRVVAKPVVTHRRGDRGAAARGRRRPGLRRGHRLDAHVLAGQDVDRRAHRPAQAARPPPHAVQPRPAVVGDRHGLHEPEPVGARRPRVRVHPDAAAPQPQDGRRPLAGPAVAARLGSWARAAVGWHEAHQLRIARFGDNMREVAVTEGDKVEAQARLGFSVNGYGVDDLVAARRGRRRRRRRPRSSTPTRRPTTSRRSCGRAANGMASLRAAARIEAGLRSFLEDGGFGAFTDTFEDLGALDAAAGDRRPAADGRRLRLRRRGRLEGRRARAHPQGHGRGPARRDVVHGGLHLPPGRPRARGARRAHARGLPVDRGGQADVRDPPAVASAASATRSGSCSTPPPARPSSSASPISAIASA